MPNCAIKRGFLMLRDCGATTSRICPECGRAACNDHLVLDAGGKSWVCVECNAARDTEEPPEELDGATTSAAWRHRYRENYYRNQSYAPFYAGAYFSSYYDQEDLRAVEPVAPEPGEPLELEGGLDFSDS